VRNADGVLLVPFASEGSRRLFGVEPEVLQSDVQGLLRLIYPPDRAAFTDSWQAAECTQSRWQWEGRVLTSEGTARGVSGVAHPDVQEDGAIVWDGLLTDISKRKRAEAALQIAHDELELRVASRTAELRHSNTKLQAEISERQMAEEALRSVLVELEQARVEAEAANRAKSEFLSRVSHELRTPMNAILGFAQLLEWDNLPEEQMESVQQILRAGRHLLKLINEVLDISNIEAGAIAISAQSIEADRLCEEVLALIRPLAEKENVALQTAGQAAELHIWADALRLRQVLLNLLSNAVKYNRPGGSVTLGAAAVGEGRVRLWVSDTGWGLSEAQQSRLFMPFDRLGAERSEVEGTGIGLVLARRLVEAMGGTIGVESEEGKGSTFWIELPSEAVQSNTSNTEAMAAGVA
jgi:signal transduction histidine kinase